MQKNDGFQKEIMSVLNHVNSREHRVYSHVKMDWSSTLRLWTLAINKISDHIDEQRKNHRIYLGEEIKIPPNLIFL